MAFFYRALATGLVLLGGAAPGNAADGNAAAENSGSGLQVQIFVENDKWNRTDRHYTNGLKVGFGVEREALPLVRVFDGPIEDICDSSRRHYGAFIGQNMYTPKNISDPAPQLLDRPWAGWTYVGLVGQCVAKGTEKSRTHDVLHTLEIDVGMVGPDSRADDVQVWWHRLIDSPRPEGWANQLPNEIAFVASYFQKRRYVLTGGEVGLDVIPHFGVSLGTVTTFARAGGMVRYGFNKTGFGPDTIEPGGAMLQSARSRDEEGASRKKCDLLAFKGLGCEWYVFGGLDARLVGYNIFLDGTVFKDSPSVDRRPFVYDVLFGLSVRAGALRASVTRVMRSEEFKTARGGGGRQGFHSINFGFEF